MKHALVVGGTGMLADVTRWLAEEDFHVSVVGRKSEKMQRLTEQPKQAGEIHPVLVDYTKTAELEAAIVEQIRQHGPLALVVAWIHANAPEALPTVIRLADQSKQKWSLFHVLGSSRNLAAIRNGTKVPETCRYHQIQLGFVVGNGKSRWLTNQEISSGVIEAIQNDEPVLTVGTLEPWNNRPG